MPNPASALNAVAGADSDAGIAGLGQDHDHREDRRKRLNERQGKSSDGRSTTPPGASQLAILGEQIGVRTLLIVPGEPPVAIAKRAIRPAASKARRRHAGYRRPPRDRRELMAEVAAASARRRPSP